MKEAVYLWGDAVLETDAQVNNKDWNKGDILELMKVVDFIKADKFIVLAINHSKDGLEGNIQTSKLQIRNNGHLKVLVKAFFRTAPKVVFDVDEDTLLIRGDAVLDVDIAMKGNDWNKGDVLEVDKITEFIGNDEFWVRVINHCKDGDSGIVKTSQISVRHNGHLKILAKNYFNK